MDYFERKCFNRLEDRYLTPPEEQDFDYEDWFDTRADMDYDSMREDALLETDC